ncbi:MAG: fasciclin domain-containing protein [Acidobacteria bacterium]|jgi:uncharacterized surface protein with fasciclin (FAS1) repeats|nr:fasciclin domain-containing protein [Acidobacteriota bacterium]
MSTLLMGMNPGRGGNRPGHPAQEAQMNRSIARSILFALAVLAALAAPFALAGSGKSSSGASMDIVDTAVAAGNFKTLAAALQAAGLVDTLKGAGPFTVFAPTDEAFAKLPAGTLESLLKPENKAKLASILTYHVVPGAVGSDKVVKMTSAKTVQGQSVKISVTGGTVMVDNAKVVKTDIMATNGIIHVIDSVLLPQ